MSATDVDRPVKRIRTGRAVAIGAAVVNVLVFAMDVASGSPLAPLPAVLVVVLLVLVFVETRLIRTLEQARELARPRMTAEDYRQLREMELELGWEPSEVPADAEVSPYASLTAGDIEEAHERLSGARQCRCRPEDRCAVEVHAEDRAVPVVTYRATCGRRIGEASPSAPMTGPGGRWRPLSELPEAEATPEGIPAEPLIERMRRELETPAPGKAAWDDVAYPSEASQHFAQLARVGLEHCLSYCPLCLYRLFGPLPDGVKSDASMWQWLEENWGWRQ